MLTARQMLELMEAEEGLRRDKATGVFYDLHPDLQKRLNAVQSAIRICKKRQDEKSIRYFDECCDLAWSTALAIRQREAMIRNIQAVFAW